MTTNVCRQCYRGDLSRDEIGLSKKLLGKHTMDYLCLQCAANYFRVSEEGLKERIHMYKADGCLLFVGDEIKFD